MKNLEILSREQAPANAQAIFDNLKQKLGMVPNLYATAANSPSALQGILEYGATLGKGALSQKEIEAIALVVSQVNGCDYCLSAHTAVGKMVGYSEEQTLQLRKAAIEDEKLRALTTLAKAIAETKGRPEQGLVDNFFAAGYSKAALVDVLGFVAVNTFNNYLNNLVETTIDFPLAPEL